MEKSYQFFKVVFDHIEQVLPEQWEQGDLEGGFISRNIGVASTITIIWDIVEHIRFKKAIDFEKLNASEIFDEIQPYLNKVLDFVGGLNREDLYNLSKQWGSTGVKKVRQEFQKVIYDHYRDFQPTGLLQFIKESSGIFNDSTLTICDEMQISINKFILKTLKQEYGEEDKKWWRIGVPKQIQKDCALKSIDTDPPEPDENFLLLLDYQKIVNNNWKLFGEKFTPPDLKQAKKEDKTGWFVRFNTIRNKVKHPERKDVTEEEYKFIMDLGKWLLSNIN